MQQPSDATVLVGMILFVITLLAAVVLLLLGLSVLVNGLGGTAALRVGWTCIGIGLGCAIATTGLAIWLAKCRYGPTCCRNCGYDLRGSKASERCPECGELRLLRRFERNQRPHL